MIEGSSYAERWIIFMSAAVLVFAGCASRQYTDDTVRLPPASTELAGMYGEMNPPYTHTPLAMECS
ncbi:MAG: hypothetical protein ACLFST_14630 [Spirochaetia bacterium]